MSDTCMHWSGFETPVGTLRLVADAQGLRRVCVIGSPDEVPSEWVRSDDALAGVRAQLEEYFAGTRRTFDLTLAPEGSPFDHATWDALRGIPHGATISYAELARRVGRPGASRAVGGANGRNPLAIVIPCHRVVASDGTLGGYAGGLDMKRLLLGLEGVRPFADRELLPLR